MIEHFIPRASSYAASIDHLIWLVTWLVGFWFVLAEVVFFWLILRYRAKPGARALYVTGHEKQYTKWISRSHQAILVCDVVIVWAAISVWVNVKQRLEPAQETIRVVSQQWAWAVQHAGPDGQLDTPDDIWTLNEIHLTANTVYNYELSSKDVLHSLSIPAFRLKHDAIPGRVVKGWFKPTAAGTYDLQCAEICGIGHALMPGTVVVETPEQHAAWMAADHTLANAH